MRAVAIEGFADLAIQSRQAQSAVDEPGAGVASILQRLHDMRRQRPALYQAMFVLPTDVEFASEDTPSPLKAAFGEFVGIDLLVSQIVNDRGG